MSLPSSVTIREVGPREGFQTSTVPIDVTHKIELIEALARAGASEIEVTAFVRPDRVPQMADAEEVVRRVEPLVSRYPATAFTALYLNQRGLDRALNYPFLLTRGWIYTAVSREFLKRNNNQSHDDVVQEIPRWLEKFSQAGLSVHGVMISTAFGCNYSGAVADDQLFEVLDGVLHALAHHGVVPREISLADTMGWGNPAQIRRIIARLRKKLPTVHISLHLHDTRGTGIANVYAGLLEGVNVFESSVGGLGGCPFAPGAAGNVATEDVVYLCHSMGISTGLALERYVEAFHVAERIMGGRLPGKYARSVAALAHPPVAVKE